MMASPKYGDSKFYILWCILIDKMTFGRTDQGRIRYCHVVDVKTKY